ncbi:bifunctional DNA-binding transcriptional regulator/O6-methylguanine-DNA methyltransferase Ada [Paracoccus ravus]|uniref:bifunctional DNA-binding transcriptional regulator/O6-methylguanine-DNA methyltransferase Ada n=1 Tax=Paracoccus ravus TaxID=2447760 RepID=UPI00106E3F05|nr:bifunctional DNA-binding transcriptional regulator/O6-methylguanine-DNA methyltransferase Ada [Paracoccus ravus]
MFMSPDQNTTPDPRWTAVIARDSSADGRFVFAVRTTGIYCRPSCSSRRARPENVAFFASPDEAEAAGFRPCLRCHPRGLSAAQANDALVAEACRIIENAEDIPDIAALADKIGLSRFHFHREFKARTGMTPAAYARARRAERFRAALTETESVTEAVQAAGYGSTSRVYEDAAQVLGMRPSDYRRGGRDAVIRYAVAPSALGMVLVAATKTGLCAISLGDEAQPLVQELRARFPKAELAEGAADFAQIVRRVVAFVEAPGTGLDLPLDIRGTAFQRRVWQALQDLRAGETVSYAELAARLGEPRAVRAVAGACAANTLAVAIPCHRVLRSDGSISGYRWGVPRKRELLRRETEG